MSSRTELDQYNPSPEWIRYFLGYGALFLGMLLAKIKVKGRHHIPDKSPYIVVSNHFDMVDGLFVVYALQRPITFLMASDQVLDWYFKWAVWLYGFIPTNRIKLAPSTIKKAKTILQKKHILGILPEGVSTDSKLRRAKRGVVYLSTIENTLILPVGVYGLKQAWANWLRGIRPKVQIQIGKPFWPKDGASDHMNREEQIEIIGKNIMCRIAALLPKKAHGIYSGDTRIESYAKLNES